MGYEYKIKFNIPSDFNSERLRERLPSNAIPGSAWTAFEWSVKTDGIFFLDNGKSNASSVAFRVLIDEALAYSNKVTIEEG